MAQVRSHFEIVREAANYSRSGNPNDVRQYVSTLTSPFIPSGPLKELVDRRVVDLQLRHMAGTLPPVSEERLVKALNDLASRVGLPEYGRTSATEFRLFRVRMLQLVPQLNSTAITRPEDFVNGKGQHMKRIASNMEPAEMAYLICSLALQKRANPDFQMTEEELQKKYISFRQQRLDSANLNESKYDLRNEAELHPTAKPERGQAINLAMKSFASSMKNVSDFDAMLKNFIGELGYDQ